jgi:hypothetical protein
MTLSGRPTRPLVAGMAVTVALAGAIAAPTAAAAAATTTLYVSPTGTGSTCTAAQPCALATAQTTVRSMVAGMSGDIAVELADGVYRLTSPWTLGAADSGANGYTVAWRAAPSARPVISGARQITGWRLADSAKGIWQADAGTGADTRQLYVDGVLAIRARTTVDRAALTATATGLRFSASSLSYLNNLPAQNRVEVHGVGSFTDRYAPVQSIAGNFITMQQPAWNNNTFGYDTLTSPFRAGPLYLENAYEFLDAAGEWHLNTSTGVLSYKPLAGQDMSRADVELPLLQSLVQIGGSYAAPAHHLSFSGITFTGTSWRGPSSSQGFADQQTGAFISGTWSRPSDAITSCQSGCQLFEAVRPHWNQMPAAVQISAANNITFANARFANLGQTAVGIGNDANAHGTGVGLGASSITVTRSEFLQSAAGAIIAGGVRADAHHPSDPRMVNRDITISNNKVHDLGRDYRGSTSFLPTYVTNATISHNEVYNMPYSGMSLGYGWGSNEPGGNNEYTKRGLYNYQPRYTTATTATNNKLIGNYIHDVMQQMTDGGCIYTLSWNPGATITGNYCQRMNGWYGLYFDEGSKHYTADHNVFSETGTWATGNWWGGENMGTLTVHDNWSTNNVSNVVNGEHGNKVYANTVVSGGNWPAAARTVMSSAGVEP